MKKILFLFLLLVPLTTFAHSGNTDSYGCHTCYTNCSLYGLSYGEYHCHTSTVTVPLCYYPNYSGCKYESDYSALQTSQITSGLSRFASSEASNALALCRDQINKYQADLLVYNNCLVTFYGGTSSSTSPSAPAPTTITLTNTELCQNKHGHYSHYNETTKSCECNDNYAPDDSATYQCIDINAYCRDGLGSYGQAKVYKYIDGGYLANCKCQDPFVLNQTNSACISPSITTAISTTNLYQRPTSTVIIPTVLNSYTGMYGRKVYTDRPDPLKIIGAMVKGETDPATYIVDSIGQLRWIKTEAVAKRLFGTAWDGYITWFNDSIIYTYKFGATIEE